MGKGMLKGFVPYRDLFEQKGPLLYLIHALAYLVDRTGFLGVFVFEVASLSMSLWIADKIVRLFISNQFNGFILPIFTCLTLVSSNFESGDSAEEFCLPLILGLMYLMCRHFLKNPLGTLTDRQALAVGSLGGCVLMIKYTMLGFWIGFALVLTAGCVQRRQVRELLRTVLFVLAGVALSVLPWLVYFVLNRALGSFFETYFLTNIRFYAQAMSLLDRIRLIGKAVGSGFGNNVVAGMITLFGIGVFAFGRRHFPTRHGRLVLPVCAAVQILATYYSGRNYSYYYLTFFPFLLFGLIAIVGVIQARKTIRLPIREKVALTVCLLLILTVVTISTSPNIPLINKSREDYPQFAFAEIINSVPGATVLNYGFLDGGFYTAADVTPAFRFFMLNNIDYQNMPEMLDEQKRYILDREATFVIFRMNMDESPSGLQIPGLHEHYKLAALGSFPYRGTGLVFKYALFKLKTSSLPSGHPR